MGFTLNPIALRKAKIVHNFGLSECNRVKGKNAPKEAKTFLQLLAALEKGGNKENCGVTFPESVPIHLDLDIHVFHIVVVSSHCQK